MKFETKQKINHYLKFNKIAFTYNNFEMLKRNYLKIDIIINENRINEI